MSPSNLSGSTLNAVKEFSSQLPLSTILRARNSKHCCLTHEETKAQKGEIPCPSHTASKWWGQDLTSDSLTVEFLVTAPTSYSLTKSRLDIQSMKAIIIVAVIIFFIIIVIIQCHNKKSPSIRVVFWNVPTETNSWWKSKDANVSVDLSGQTGGDRHKGRERSLESKTLGCDFSLG